VPARRLGRHAHRHVADDHADLAFEINAMGFVDCLDVIVGADEGIGAALVHQRVGPERRRHLHAARLAHQLDMHDVSRAVGPLIGAWQGCRERLGVEIEGAGGLALGELLGKRAELGFDCRPVVERLLQGRRDAARPHGLFDGAVDHDQRAVTAAFFQ
jgi:hypothetical protein